MGKCHHRSHSYDSAYYQNQQQKQHITFSDQTKYSSSSLLQCLQNDTLIEDEDDTSTKVNSEEEKNQNLFTWTLESLDKIYTKYSPAIVLENRGNTARDHLANERTYLAWFRTSISLITLGIGIIQVYHGSNAHHKRLGRILGLIFVMASVLFLYFGNVRYFHAQYALQHGNFPASRGIVTYASFCILFLFVGMFTVMIFENFK